MMNTIFPWQKKLFQTLCQLSKDKHSQTLLLQGLPGIGKSQLMQTFADFVLCTDSSKQNNNCKTCKSCLLLQHHSHPDLIVIQPDDKNSIKIEVIRETLTQLAQKPILNNRRVVLIHHVEALTTAAANSLLKILEEPPLDTFFVLSTSAKQSLLPTIISRCVVFAVQVTELAAVEQWLVHQKLNYQVDDLNLLVKIYGLAPLEIANALKEQRLQLLHTIFNDLENIKNGNIDPIKTAERWLKHDFNQVCCFWFLWLRMQAEQPKTRFFKLLDQLFAIKRLTDANIGINKQLALESLLVDMQN